MPGCQAVLCPGTAVGWHRCGSRMKRRTTASPCFQPTAWSCVQWKPPWRVQPGDPPEFSVGICCVFLHCCGWQNNITVMCAFPPLVTEENLFICFQSELLPKKCLEMGKKCALWRCTGGFLYENVYVFIVSCPGSPWSVGWTWDTACGVLIIFVDNWKPFGWEAKAVHVTSNHPENPAALPHTRGLCFGAACSWRSRDKGPDDNIDTKHFCPFWLIPRE